MYVLRATPRLPHRYVRWIDWCKIAFIVDVNTASTKMASVLRKLEQVALALRCCTRLSVTTMPPLCSLSYRFTMLLSTPPSHTILTALLLP